MDNKSGSWYFVLQATGVAAGNFQANVFVQSPDVSRLYRIIGMDLSYRRFNAAGLAYSNEVTIAELGLVNGSGTDGFLSALDKGLSDPPAISTNFSSAYSAYGIIWSGPLTQSFKDLSKGGLFLRPGTAPAMYINFMADANQGAFIAGDVVRARFRIDWEVSESVDKYAFQ